MNVSMKGMDFLKKIVAHKRDLLRKKQPFFSSLREKVDGQTHSRYAVFKKRIAQPGGIQLIAEVKKASPSKGLLREDFHPVEIARIYEANGAAAISVLTEDRYFLGRPEYVRRIHQAVRVPLLMKDFVIDEDQIYEAWFYGASAVLLIVAILDDEQIASFIQTATRLDMDCLVEVHNEEELKRAVDQGAEIIGVNNRDLRTFDVTLEVSERLIPLIPSDKVVVAESGIHTHQDLQRLKKLGVNAVLVGEALMRAKDIGRQTRDLMTGKDDKI